MTLVLAAILVLVAGSEPRTNGNGIKSSMVILVPPDSEGWFEVEIRNRSANEAHGLLRVIACGEVKFSGDVSGGFLPKSQPFAPRGVETNSRCPSVPIEQAWSSWIETSRDIGIL